MKFNKLLLLLRIVFVFLFIPFKILAQNPTIETTRLEIVDKRLEIAYDVLKSKKNTRLEVWVDIYNSRGEKINARTFSGDIGSNLEPGKEKIISWDYNADGLVLDEEVEVFVKAKVTTIAGTISTGKTLALSTLVPGLGISAVEKNKPFWLLGVFGYASVGSSLYLNSSYKSNYDKYLKATDSQEAQNYFTKSENQQQLSKVMAYTAIGTWSVSIIWTILRTRQHNKSIGLIQKENGFMFYSRLDPVFKKPMIGFYYTF